MNDINDNITGSNANTTGSNANINNGNEGDDSIITRTLVPEAERMAFVDRLFSIKYVLQLEPTVFQFAEHLAAEYHGGYWQFYALSNGGFYMAPRSDTVYAASSLNGFEGKMTADALGVTACLYACSHLSFGDDSTGSGGGGFAEICAGQYHLLREYMFGHAEVRSILRAID